MKRSSSIILLLISVPAITASEGQWATLTYNAKGRHALHAYDVKPARRAGEAGIIAGWLDHNRVHRHPDETYFCVWRDTGPNEYADRGSGSGRPSEIFLTCRFGTSRWSPPANLIEAATEDVKRDSALIRIGWKRSVKGYSIKRFELELKRPPSPFFRSQNLTERELSELGIRVSRMVAPSTPRSDLIIHLTARVPSRMNSGMKAIGPIIPIEIEGTATPIPEWLSY